MIERGLVEWKVDQNTKLLGSVLPFVQGLVLFAGHRPKPVGGVSIKNIVSVVRPVWAMPGQFQNYAASKGEWKVFTPGIWLGKVVSESITVNAVAPGFIDTDMNQGLDEGQRSAMLEQDPAWRLGQADKICRSGSNFGRRVRWLYSPVQSIPVNGGMYMIKLCPSGMGLSAQEGGNNFYAVEGPVALDLFEDKTFVLE